MRLEVMNHVDPIGDINLNKLNVLAVFESHGYPGEPGYARNVCNTNYPMAVKDRDEADWAETNWNAYRRTIYSTDPIYAADIK